MELTISLQDLFLIIAGLSIIAITFALLPFLIQLRKTGHRAEKMMDNLDREIEPLLISLNKTAAQVQKLSENINGKLAETDTIIKTARYAGESLLVTSNLMKTVLTPFITRAGGLSMGIRTFMHFLHRSRQAKKKEEQTNE